MSCDPALISWPINHANAMDALVELLRDIPAVIYAGTNTAPTQCGTPELWHHLATRSVISAHKSHEFWVIHYGTPTTTPRPALGEERQALRPAPPSSVNASPKANYLTALGSKPGGKQ